MASVEELTQLLKADCNGDNLFDHLTDTLLELLVQRPEDPLQAFDTVSTKIRQSKVDVEVPSKPDVHADHVCLFLFFSSFIVTHAHLSLPLT